MLSPPMLRELASYFKRGSGVALGRVGLLGPYIPSSYTVGHVSCCATSAGNMLTLLLHHHSHLQCKHMLSMKDTEL